MALSGPLQAFKGRLYVAQAAEGTFGAGATITHYFNTLAMPALGVDQAFVDDAELMTGYEGPTTQIPTERSFASTIPLWASPEAVGMFAGFLMGVDTISTGTGYGIHTLTNAALSVLAYGQTLEGHMQGSTGDDDVDSKHYGVTVTKITFSGGRTGMVRMDVEAIGPGASASSSSPTESGLLTATIFFPVGKAKISIKPEASEGATPWGGTFTAPTGAGQFANTLTGGAGALAAIDLSQHLENWTVTIERQLTADRASGSSTTVGVTGSQPAVVRHKASANLTWIVDAATKVLAKNLYNSSQANNAGYGLVLEMVSDLAAGVKIKSACVVLPLVKHAERPKAQAGLDLWMQDVSLVSHDQKSGTNYGHFRVFTVDANQSVYCSA